MKILVFSDSHLDQNFEEKKLSFLKKIIESADQVIINGDFWDGYSLSFDEFLASRWNELFPLLKKKKTVYTFGNHDKKVLSDKRISQFCSTATISYKLNPPAGGSRYTYIFEHGNRLAPYFDDLWNITKLPKALNTFLAAIEGFAVRLLGETALKILFGKFNKQIKAALKTTLKENEIYACGHTHVAELDLQNKFLNTGLVRHGLARYAIIENGIPTLHKEKYR